MLCGKVVGVAVIVGLSVWMEELTRACDQTSNSACSGFIVQGMYTYMY